MTFVQLRVYGNAESAFVSSSSMPKKKWVCQKLGIHIHEPVITHAGNVVYKPQWPEPGPASKRIWTELDGMYDQLQKPNPHPLNSSDGNEKTRTNWGTSVFNHLLYDTNCGYL